MINIYGNTKKKKERKLHKIIEDKMHSLEITKEHLNSRLYITYSHWLVGWLY